MELHSSNIQIFVGNKIIHYNFLAMTKEAIQEQVNVINRATENALRSKEAAEKFLVDAGIIKKDEVAVKEPPKKK